jgi:hypothetical protein
MSRVVLQHLQEKCLVPDHAYMLLQILGDSPKIEGMESDLPGRWVVDDPYMAERPPVGGMWPVIVVENGVCHRSWHLDDE